VNVGVEGANYGWPGIEGKRTTQQAPADYQDPLYAYKHDIANTGDLNTLNQNLDLEQLLLTLGIDTGQAKGQTAWDQMLKQAGYDAASTEAAQNWQRANTVSDTNVGNTNEWNQGLISTLLSIIGSKAPGTTLPANVGAFV